jgi:hypothetical protein
LEHDAVIELFNEVLTLAEQRSLLSGEYFSVDGTLLEAWASHKSFVLKDGNDQDGNDFKGKTRSNATHASRTDDDARLYRKGNTASELRYIGHTLSDNRHGLIASAMVTIANGHAERQAAKAMINDAVHANNDPNATITLGADKGYDAKEFIEALANMKVTPHVAQNKSGRRSAVPDKVVNTEGHNISQQKRKRIEQGSCWAKTIGNVRQATVRRLEKVDQMFVLTMAAYNLTRMRSLGQLHAEAAQKGKNGGKQSDNALNPPPKHLIKRLIALHETTIVTA